MEIAGGHPAEGAAANPLGFLAAFGLVVVPLWCTADALTGKSRLYRLYKAGEDLLRSSLPLQVVLVTLLATNWLWGILKQL